MIADCSLRKALFIALAICSVPLAPALAGEIRLTMRASNLVIEGEFRGFESDAYLILVDDVDGETVTLHVPAKQVICEGDDCIEFLRASGD